MRQEPINTDGMRSFTEILGAPSGRYFGSGFRRVEYFPRYNLVVGDGAVQRVNSSWLVSYPSDWSLGATGLPRPRHLSSIDALVIFSGAVDKALQCWTDLEQAALTIERLCIRSGARPVTQLAAVPSKTTVTRVHNTCLNAVASVAGFTVSAEIGVLFESRMAERGTGPRIRASENVSISGFVSEVDVVGRAVTTLHRRSRRVDAAVTGGVQAPWGTLSYVDSIVLFGQVAQVLIQLTEGIDRGSIDNLWMRRMEFRHQPVPDVSLFRVHARLLKHVVIHRAGKAMHSLTMVATSEHGVEADAVFGFVEPVEAQFE